MQFNPTKIYWQAHRGGGGVEAPDNTLYAMEYGWGLGGIPEADIRVTADNQVVCLHDNSLGRTTDAPAELASLPVGELSLAQIRQYDASKKFRADLAGERVPTVREVFERMKKDPSRYLYTDIKNYDAERFPVLLEKFLSLVREFDLAGKIIVAGMDYELNCRFKKELPEINTMQWIGVDLRSPAPGHPGSLRDPERASGSVPLRRIYAGSDPRTPGDRNQALRHRRTHAFQQDPCGRRRRKGSFRRLEEEIRTLQENFTPQEGYHAQNDSLQESSRIRGSAPHGQRVFPETARSGLGAGGSRESRRGRRHRDRRPHRFGNGKAE